MLSRKGSNAGMMAVAQAGVDRTRVGERLHAALAGLQELHLLRDRQSEMVSWALKADREEPVTSVHPDDPRLMRAEEQRLEATLTALKQQLSRLRKQDVGLKTHLQQLDQQINELKLDVNKASTDQLETDSRPSSGFYELSDGGSGSLSNSCTSLHSVCLSSSQSSLLVASISPVNTQTEPQIQSEVARRRSADESTTQTTAPRAKGLHLGSSRIRASTNGTEKARPRPVSTGDLDRMVAQIQNYNKPAVDTTKPTPNANGQVSSVDPKFHSNLVSRTGAEVYHYPSPLHAVALQSPIFSPNSDPATNGLLGHQISPVNGTNSLQRVSPSYDTKTLGYIDKILQRSFSKLHFESGTDTLQSQSSHRKPSEVVTVFPEVVSQREVSPAQPPVPSHNTNVPQDNDQKRHCYASQEAADNTNHKQLLRGGHEVSHRLSFPADAREYSSDEVTTSTLKKTNKFQAQYLSLSRSHSDYRSSDNTEPRQHDRKSQKQRAIVSQSSSTEECPSFEGHVPHSRSPQFVHAKFVPAGSQRVKVRHADRKSKSVKLKKKSGEKPRAPKQHHGYSSGEKSKDSASSGSKSEQKRSAKGKAVQKSPIYLSDERRYGSGSDSSHCGPGFMHMQKIQAKPQPNLSVSKSGKSRKPQAMEYEVDRKKRQGQMDQAPASYRQRSREPQIAQNVHIVRSMSARAGQWLQPAHPHFPSSKSSNSFLHNLNSRYPAAPYHLTSRYPPRCESEYSAECASLFHSTIAASSDGEMSDNTTNRFGDSESSQSYQSFSDSDSSLSFDEDDLLDDEGGLVWANAAMGPTAAMAPTAAGRPMHQQQQQQPPRPAQSACRIKASRALKKKIRRFQPASLKVMTLV